MSDGVWSVLSAGVIAASAFGLGWGAVKILEMFEDKDDPDE
jgi:hypothetical protein